MNKKEKSKFHHYSLFVAHNSRSGFTLVELLISITIMVILAGVSFINVVNYKNRQEITSNVQEIVTVLRSAQDRSLSQEGGSRWGIHFENPAEAMDFYELFRGISYSSGIVVSRSVLSSDIQFDSPAAGSSSTVIFSPITGLPDAVINIKISLMGSPSVSSTITVSSNGKISY